MTENTLPDYTNPPVIETILGVQFAPIENFSNAHLGSFWKALEDDPDEWVHLNDAPPLARQIETFSDDSNWGAASLQIRLSSQAPSSRLQIKNSSNNWMVQIQNDRFHVNWLGQDGNEYPRYSEVKNGFERLFSKFVEFVNDEIKSELKLNQWEVTYLNHIPKGGVWTTPNDWPFMQLFGDPKLSESELTFESFAGEWHYIIPENRGRLHINWKHGKQDGRDENELVVLNMTARGAIPADSQSMDEIGPCLDLGRETIVNTFRSIMSDQSNDSWGLKR